MKKLLPSDCTVLITGAAGFIGFHLATRYHRAGYRVIGVDRCKESSPPAINQIRMSMLCEEKIPVQLGDLAQADFVADIVAQHRPHLIFHMAANANVRCLDARKFSENISGLVNMLAAAREHPPVHFIYASSGSVYGENAPRPFCENAVLTQPVSCYAKSKFAGEIIANIWAKGSDFPVTGLRFFNVYGPWGRPEMAPFQFADSLALGRKTPIITGHTSRSWLYIDDAIQACEALAEMPPCIREDARIVNIAGPRLVNTMDALHIISKFMDKIPRIVHRPSAAKEVSSNPADTGLLESLTGRVPQTVFEDGIRHFLEWHREEWLPAIRNYHSPMSGNAENHATAMQQHGT